MSYLDMNKDDLEDCVARNGLCDDMFFGLHEDASDRIEVLQSLVRELFNDLENRHADDLVDEYKERFGDFL